MFINNPNDMKVQEIMKENKKIDIETIIEITGLNKEEIEKL